MERRIAIATAATVLLIIDLCWITMQQPMYAALVRSVQGRQMSAHIPSALLSYVFVVLGFVGLVAPNVHATSSPPRALAHGALVGFVVYGVFNATNAAIFDNYNAKTAIFDTLWGTFLFGISALLFSNLFRL